MAAPEQSVGHVAAVELGEGQHVQRRDQEPEPGSHAHGVQHDVAAGWQLGVDQAGEDLQRAHGANCGTKPVALPLPRMAGPLTAARI